MVDITDNYNIKHAAMQCYRLPLSCKHYIYHIEGLSRYRGLTLHAQERMAEGFTGVPASDWQGLVENLVVLRGRQEILEHR